MNYIDLYAEYGAMGVLVMLFIYGYVKQSKRADEQADALSGLMKENEEQSTRIANIEGIVLKPVLLNCGLSILTNSCE